MFSQSFATRTNNNTFPEMFASPDKEICKFSGSKETPMCSYL